MEQVRSFIAIELPDELKQGLAQIEDHLKRSRSAGVKWVNPDDIHLTLKFLGSIAMNRTSEITGAIEVAARGISPFYLEAKGLGVFPNPRRTQVAWVGIGGEVDKLNQLKKQIETSLSHLDFTPETRIFTPHLTLARLRNQASPDVRQRFGQLITTTRFERTCTMQVDTISLMKSQISREGAIYSRLSATRLNKNSALG